MRKHFLKWNYLFWFCWSSAQAFTYLTVPVGNAGNPADPLTGFGSVSANYEMGLYQVTIQQYTDFLNAVAATDPYGCWNPAMQSVINVAGIARSGTSGSYSYAVMNNGGDSAQRPITSVSWFSAARFANWVANGQPSGVEDETTTEDGAYTLLGKVSGSTVTLNTTNINTGSPPTFFLPSDDQWYKAAYYSGTGAVYYKYATQTNVLPGNTIGSTPNQVNYISNATGYCTTQSFTTSTSVNYLTNVGAFSNSPSFYGTFDQTGNVWEWTAPNAVASDYASFRGGAFTSSPEPYLLSSYFLSTFPDQTAVNIGFRLAAPG